MKNSSKGGIQSAGSVRRIAFSVVVFLLFLILLEAGLRSFHGLRIFANAFGRVTQFSDYLGWEPVPDMHYKGTMKGYGEVDYSTTKYGFRIFGDIHTERTKILVIGDSITQAYTVSDGETYYDYLKNNDIHTEVFAYGGGGFGSLQEYMVLDRFFESIKPDIIIWQFSDNDIFNNCHELESATYKNNHMIRPYLKEGRIQRLYPKRTDGWSGCVYKLGQHSRLFRFIDIRLDIFKAERYKSVEDELSKDHPLMKKAVRTTSEIMGLVRKRVGTTPIVAFAVGQPEWLPVDNFRAISEEQGVHYVSGVSEAIKEAKDSGVRVDGSPYDGHWNSVAHRIAGEIILDYLNKESLL